jgi:hypothetical protein
MTDIGANAHPSFHFPLRGIGIAIPKGVDFIVYAGRAQTPSTGGCRVRLANMFEPGAVLKRDKIL